MRYLLARVRFGEGSALQNLGGFDGSQVAREEARRTFADAGDTRGVAGSLNNVALNLAYRGDLERAAGLCDESVGAFRGLAGRHDLASALSDRRDLLCARGDLAGARKNCEEAPALRVGMSAE